jgi:hypothetical protein
MTVIDLGGEALDEQFDRLKSDMTQYGLSWWTTDLDARARWKSDSALYGRLHALLKRGRAIRTADVYQVDVAWVDPRPVIHTEIVTKLLGECHSFVDAPRPPAFLLFGGPGSGKSSSLRPLISRPGMVAPVPLDADAVRVELPEYKDGRGSGIVQDECAFITYGELRETFLAGTPNPAGVCIDLIGDPEYSVKDWWRLDRAGYRVYALLAQCPLEQAIERIKRRAVETGRIVDLDFARKVGDRPRKALDALLDADRHGTIDLAGWSVFDTSDSAFPGAPTVVEGDGSFGSVGAAATKVAS